MIGNGYGSEFHLLRWMGRHRELFNQRVSTAVGRPGSVIKWMDFGFDGPVGPGTSGLELGTSSGPYRTVYISSFFQYRSHRYKSLP